MQRGRVTAVLGPRRRKQILSLLASSTQALLGPRERNGFGILMYHRVVPSPPGLPRPTYNVPPDRLEAQLLGLFRRGFEPWPLRKLIEFHCAGRPIPHTAFAVTFDDGYDNVYACAWPVLARLGVPATVFLATAYLDSREPFPMDGWPPTGFPRGPALCWRPLTTDHCRQMQASGLIELGAHTHTHQDFRGRSQHFAEDLRRCLAELRRRFGIEQATFAFPYGDTNLGFAGPDLTAVARDLGVLCALTTDAGIVRAHDDRFAWCRWMPEDFDTGASLAAKLGGWYDVWRRTGQAGRAMLLPIQPRPA
jgi:peptidoglycan/xylan/chitin deacetylase (PgdA/CDA1 family)